MARTSMRDAVIDGAKDELVDLIVYRAFYPVLMAFRAGPSKTKIEHLQEIAWGEIERLRRCSSVEEVITSFERDLGARPNVIIRSDLQQLHLPVLDDIRDDSERRARELGFEPDSLLTTPLSSSSTGEEPMDQDRISERAYALWQNAGQPDGAHEEHWQQAIREIEAEDGSTAQDPPVTADSIAKKTRTAKPAT